jgi:hypothetical protein
MRVIKGLVLWTLFIAFLFIAVTALDMGEYTIAAVMGGISIVCLWAAPSGSKKDVDRHGTEYTRR